MRVESSRVVLEATLLLLVVAASTSDEMFKDQQEKKCFEHNMECASKINLHSMDCLWSNPSECVFKMITKLPEQKEQICNRVKLYNECWKNYDMEVCKASNERIIYEELFRNICELYGDEVIKAKSCVEKQETKTCVEEYHSTRGTKQPCDMANKFSACVSKSFKQHKCNETKAFVHSYTNPLLKRINDDCEVSVNGAPAAVAGGVVSLFAAAAVLTLFSFTL